MRTFHITIALFFAARAGSQVASYANKKAADVPVADLLVTILYIAVASWALTLL